MIQILINKLKLLNRRSPPICTDLPEWANRNGYSFSKHLCPSLEINLKLPNTIDADIAEPFYTNQKTRTLESYVLPVKNVRYIGNNGLCCILPNGEFLIEMSSWWDERIKSQPYYFQKFYTGHRFNKKRIKEPCISLLSYWWHNYYHWVHDVLCRFHIVLQEIPEIMKILVPAGLAEWQLKSLDMLGVSRDRMIFQAHDSIAICEECLIIPPPSTTARDHPAATQWLNATLRKKILTTSDHKSPNKIYISRSKAKSRRVINENDIWEVLKEAGFEKVCCEELSFLEQAAFFANASVIVAPHGAGLTNMIFAPPTTKVVEIFPKGFYNTCYYSMANALGFEYTYFSGDQIYNNDGDPDMVVDSLKIKKAIL